MNAHARTLARSNAAAHAALGVLATLGLGCAHAIAPATIPYAPTDMDGARAPADVARELAGSVDAVVAGHSNAGRFEAVKARAESLGLAPFVKPEPIDWLSVQHNTVIEIPGRSKELVYVVAHVDHIDANPLVIPSLLLDGALDPIIEWSYLSEGAVDNATGVAVALAVARAVHERPLQRTLRVLLPGAEEVGLRGSRAHAARLREDEWARLRFVVNVDGVGIKGKGTCISDNVSDVELVARAHEAAAGAGVPVGDDDMPAIGSSDYDSFADSGFAADFLRSLLFNLTGALIPQRSYFAREHHARVLNYLACEPLDAGDIVASLTTLPVGTFHGPRDNRDEVDLVRLYETYRAVLAFLRSDDAR